MGIKVLKNDFNWFYTRMPQIILHHEDARLQIWGYTSNDWNEYFLKK